MFEVGYPQLFIGTLVFDYHLYFKILYPKDLEYFDIKNSYAKVLNEESFKKVNLNTILCWGQLYGDNNFFIKILNFRPWYVIEEKELNQKEIDEPWLKDMYIGLLSKESERLKFV